MTLTKLSNNSAGSSDQQQDYSPFMQLNLANAPTELTKVTLQHQYYKLVPDLWSPEKENNDSFRFCSTPATKPKRRQLPKIPVDKKRNYFSIFNGQSKFLKYFLLLLLLFIIFSIWKIMGNE